MSQDNNPPGPPRPPAGSTGGPMAERMQALLSRAAEDQLSEQRQVSTVLTDLRQLVGGLSEQLKRTASAERVDDLGSEVGALVTELRTSTAGLGERLDVVSRLIDEQAAATSGIVAESGAGAAGLEERVAAMGSQVAAQEATMGQLSGSLTPLSGTVDTLATVQRDVAGMQERLQALGETLTGVGQMSEVRSDLAELRQDLERLGARFSQREFPTTQDVASAVGAQVTDRMVGELAPRVAEQVLSRVATTLVEQVAGSVTAAVQSGLTDKVRAATAESELRISAHVDEAILALAEALLRRRRGSRGSVLGGVSDPAVGVDAAAEAAQAEPGPEPGVEALPTAVRDRGARDLDPSRDGEAPADAAHHGGTDDAAADTEVDGEPADLVLVQAEPADAEVDDDAGDASDEPRSAPGDLPQDSAEPAEDVEAGDVGAGHLDPRDVGAGHPDTQDVDAGDVDAGDPDTQDVDARDLDARDADAGDLDAGDLETQDVDAGDVDAGDVDAGDVQDVSARDDETKDTVLVHDLDDRDAPPDGRPGTPPVPEQAAAATAERPAPARTSARTALEELLAGRQAWGYRGDLAAGGTGMTADSPETASLVDTSKAPAASSRAYTMPRTANAPAAPAVSEQAGSGGDAAPEPAAASRRDGDDDWFDEEQDGPRRRPWWRPGG